MSSFEWGPEKAKEIKDFFESKEGKKKLVEIFSNPPQKTPDPTYEERMEMYFRRFAPYTI